MGPVDGQFFFQVLLPPAVPLGQALSPCCTISSVIG